MQGKMRRLSLALVVLMLGGILGTATTQAAQEQNQEKTEEELAEEEAQKERQAVYDLPVQSNEIAGWPEGPGTYGEAAIVMEVGTGAILYAKNIDQQEYPASITKVLTALVALENGDLSDEVTFSKDCVSFLERGDSSIGLKEGNVITLEQALYAMLLASANEAAYAVGENVGTNAGHDYDWFIEQMNAKCQELGCVNSNFVNTNGLHDENHYTCARDMALIGCALFDDPEFFQIVQTKEYTIPESKTVEEHVFQQKDKMLQAGNSHYDARVIGGKTGYTTDALGTLITMAEDQDTQLVCVVLRTFTGYTYSDTSALLDYAYQNFTKTEVEGLETSEEIEEVYGATDQTGYVMLPEGVGFSQLEKQIVRDQDFGRDATINYYYEGTYLGSARAVVTEEYVASQGVQISDTEDEGVTQETAAFQWVDLLLVAVVCAGILFGILHLRRKKQAKKS